MVDIELVKALEGLAGKRGSRVVFWFFVCASGIGILFGAITGLKPALESVDWVGQRFAGTDFPWGTVGDAFFTLLIVSVFLIVFALSVGVFIGTLLRIGLWPSMQRSIRTVIEDLQGLVNQMKSEMVNAGIRPNVMQDIEASLAQIKYKSEHSVITRILNLIWRKRARGNDSESDEKN